jgi:hypothetical protein
MCDCIEKIDAHLKDHNSRVVTTFVRRGGSGGLQVQVALQTEKLNSRSRHKMEAIATYCPFCGVAYVEEENARL